MLGLSGLGLYEFTAHDLGFVELGLKILGMYVYGFRAAGRLEF